MGGRKVENGKIEILQSRRDRLGRQGDRWGRQGDRLGDRVRREQHNLRERGRREELRQEFHRLSRRIPSLGEKHKQSKQSILTQAAKYCRQLAAKLGSLQTAKERQ